MLGPVPRSASPVLLPVTSQRTSASPYGSEVRRTQTSLICNFNNAHIPRLQSFLYVQAPILARPPYCTYRNDRLLCLWIFILICGTCLSNFHPPTPVTGQSGRLHHAMNERLPVSNCGIATYLNRAIDTTGLSPARLRPFRPLPNRHVRIRMHGGVRTEGETSSVTRLTLCQS